MTEAAASGTDLVQSTITFTLDTFFENLTLIGGGLVNGTGNALSNTIIGNALANTLTGLGGFDTLDGGLGGDTLIGGTGNDTYIVDNGSDSVTEAAGEGTDTVQSSVSFTLGANLENLTLTGAGAINGTGNTLNNIIVGNINFNTINGGVGADTMNGGDGNDNYVVDNAGDSVGEAVGQGTNSVSSGIAYTLTANVENLTLTGVGNINGTGNALVNILNGNGANNTLNGGPAADTMNGGLGNDTYVVENSSDVVTEAGAAGTDTVQASVSYTLGANVENLTLTGGVAINGTGNAAVNTLVGNTNANILNGAGGADIMNGGNGNDTYIVDNVGDSAGEIAGQGTDTVQSSVSFTLGANVENLTLTGVAAINGTGNAIANTLFGNDAANILNGGPGADVMQGGLGDDTYIVENPGDVVIDGNVAGGTDTVESTLSYTLGANLENLTLTGGVTITGTGNALDNVIIGNGVANTLNGGAGADDLQGGGGNDTYIVENAGDTVTEGAAAGTDLVQSAVDFTLGANVENLTLIGVAVINGTGNSLVNSLIGNGSNNVLDGGTGADTMSGGNGNDTYIVDNAGDVVIEPGSSGTDLVASSVTYTLTANVENLILTGGLATNGTGNILANTITGNAQINVLDGGANGDTLDGGGGGDDLYGGSGNDSLNGGTGLDKFFFDTALNAVLNVDDILDFSVADDTIFLDRSIFTGIAANGTLAAGAFVNGVAAADAGDRIIYDAATGNIFYDADGTGATAQILFATVTAGTALTNADFSAFI